MGGVCGWYLGLKINLICKSEKNEGLKYENVFLFFLFIVGFIFESYVLKDRLNKEKNINLFDVLNLVWKFF